ncbi:Echinoderm microtubule-associated protein-like 1 [Cichlidogyrus casuarinus]|uniref:Echinoderm microtubule-associated protein-like 1 n=1 Tax=Cichlidogyrus casuarinus TaxID=1844966 RepID=A0ABD2QP60_9PLAT
MSVQTCQADGILKTYLRGRPLTHHLPSDQIESYDLATKLDTPKETLQLEWVYGYRGKDCRDNILYLQTGELCYFVASTVVLFNPEANTQRHYLGHNDDIKTIALHPDLVTVATGQLTGHSKKEGKDGGAQLATIDESSDHLLAIWDWKKTKKLLEVKTSGDPVLCVAWSPIDASSVVTCGKNHLNFWTIKNGALSKKQGLYEKLEKPKVVICLVFQENGDLVTGDSSGNIFVWGAGSQTISKSAISAHEGGVFSVSIASDGTIYTGGGKDGRILTWTQDLQQVSDLGCIPEWFGACRVICVTPDSDKLFFGTTRNCILQSAGGNQFEPIMQGQFDEFWALTTHPSTHQFLSAGTDSQVILWDALARKTIWSTKVQFQISCATFFPVADQDPVVVLGSTTGKWVVMNIAKHEVVAVHSDGNGEPIQCVAFSPDGKFLALGGRDNFVYIYRVSEAGLRYSKVGKCSGHSSFILHLDWDCDSTMLRSMSGDYEILFWGPEDCAQVTSAKRPDLWDVKWASHNVTLGWDVVGIWPEDADGTDINACSWNVGEEKTMLATGDDSGKVNLFSYPSSKPNAKANSYAGHSSHVTEVRFLFDDSRLISAGGKDTALFQWSITN